MLLHHKNEVYTWIEQRVNIRTGDETEDEEGIEDQQEQQQQNLRKAVGMNNG